jgi:hypothetical protein
MEEILVDVGCYSGPVALSSRRVKGFEHAKGRKARVPNWGVLNGDDLGDWVASFETIEEG